MIFTSNTAKFSLLKGFANDKINVTYKQKFFSGLVENIEGKEENAGYQHFLLFQQCFHRFLFQGH